MGKPTKSTTKLTKANEKNKQDLYKNIQTIDT